MTQPEQMQQPPALTDLVAQIRRLVDLAVRLEAPAETLHQAAREVAQVCERLAPHAPSPPPPRYFPGEVADPADRFPFDPMIGRWSPLSPPVSIRWEDPLAIGSVRFRTPYEGPPGCVHGGIIAAVFDQVLNVANMGRGVAGPTRQLSIRFRKPTPLDVELRFEAEMLRLEGREIHSVGRLFAGETLTAEAEGVFVHLPPERVMRLLER